MGAAGLAAATARRARSWALGDDRASGEASKARRVLPRAAKATAGANSLGPRGGAYRLRRCMSLAWTLSAFARAGDAMFVEDARPHVLLDELPQGERQLAQSARQIDESTSCFDPSTKAPCSCPARSHAAPAQHEQDALEELPRMTGPQSIASAAGAAPHRDGTTIASPPCRSRYRGGPLQFRCSRRSPRAPSGGLRPAGRARLLVERVFRREVIEERRLRMPTRSRRRSCSFRRIRARQRGAWRRRDLPCEAWFVRLRCSSTLA